MQRTLAPEYSAVPVLQHEDGDPSLTGYPEPWIPSYVRRNGSPDMPVLHHSQPVLFAEHPLPMLRGDGTQSRKLTELQGRPLGFEPRFLDTDEPKDAFTYLRPSAVNTSAFAHEGHLAHSGPCNGDFNFGWVPCGSTEEAYPENLIPPAQSGCPYGPDLWQHGSTAAMGAYNPLLEGAQPGGLGMPTAPRVEYDRRPRPVDFKPYTMMDYQMRNYDVKLQSGYWTLGKLGGRADEADVQVRDANSTWSRDACQLLVQLQACKPHYWHQDSTLDLLLDKRWPLLCTDLAIQEVTSACAFEPLQAPRMLRDCHSNALCATTCECRSNAQQAQAGKRLHRHGASVWNG